MLILRSLAAGVWRHPELQVVTALVNGPWAIDGSVVNVSPGLVVGFDDAFAAAMFLEQERAGPVVVEEGTIIVFADDELGHYFVAAGLAIPADDYEIDDDGVVRERERTAIEAPRRGRRAKVKGA